LLVSRAAWAAPPESWQAELDFKPNPFADWSWEEIQAHPGFVPLDYAEVHPDENKEWHGLQWFYPGGSSEAAASADAGSPHVYNWVGFIILEQHATVDTAGEPKAYVDRFVVFDQTGAGVTFVHDRGNPFGDDYVPIWFQGTINYLSDAGMFEGYI